jgi:hypothetical protein
MKSIEQTMTDLGHTSVSILKIDVEGSEWTAVAAMLESKKMRYKIKLNNNYNGLMDCYYNMEHAPICLWSECLQSTATWMFYWFIVFICLFACCYFLFVMLFVMLFVVLQETHGGGRDRPAAV